MSLIQRSPITPVIPANTELVNKTIHHQIVVVGGGAPQKIMYMADDVFKRFRFKKKS